MSQAHLQLDTTTAQRRLISLGSRAGLLAHAELQGATACFGLIQMLANGKS